MRSLLCFSMCTVLFTAADAQKQSALNDRIRDVVGRMVSPDLRTREAALGELGEVLSEDTGIYAYSSSLGRFFARHPALADQIELGLIKLLNADNEAFNDPGIPDGKYTEDDLDLYDSAIEALVSLNDERAIPALFGGATGAGGTGVALLGLRKYSQKSLAYALTQLQSPNVKLRTTAVSLSVYFLQMNRDAASHSRMVGILRVALKDPDMGVRMEAITEVEDAGDPAEFVSELREMVEHDPDAEVLRPVALKLLSKIAKP